MAITPTTVRRLTAIAAATAFGLLGWIGLRIGGAELEARPGPVAAADVMTAALVAGAAAMGAVHLIGRRSSRPRRAWVLLGTAVLSMSMLGPIYSASPVPAILLMLLHLLVGGMLVSGLAPTLPAQSPTRSRAA